MSALSQEVIDAAMQRAIALAYKGPRTSNHRVGCVILDGDGQEVGAGFYQGPGSAHAEVEALKVAGDLARGSTAIVTLEPCNHTGRTGPCTQALIQAGIAQVIFAQHDPNPVAAGGTGVLQAAGILVMDGIQTQAAMRINVAYDHVRATGRPYVVLKLAQTIDARISGSQGGPTPISGPQARLFTHELRSQCDAVLVGTGTALADDPQLTVREIQSGDQPLREIMGERDLPPGLRIFDDAASTLILREKDPKRALGTLLASGVQQVLLEGGPTLATAFLEAGCVDEVVWLLAPTLMGSGLASTQPLPRVIPVDVTEVRLIGNDVMVRGRIAPQH